MVPQIRQLNLILSFVTIAQRPLKIKQLELFLKIMLEDEVLNLEDSIRNDYSSLLVLREAQDTEKYRKDDSIVTLRHSSFYEFFKTSARKEIGPIHIDLNRAEIDFVFVLLYAIKWGFELGLWPIESYARTFLGHHLTNAIPENASSLHVKISTLLSGLFEKDTAFDGRFIEGMFFGLIHNYRHYMSSVATELAEYWLGAGDYDTASERAQHALKWHLPASRKEFEECAGSSASASDACPFTILFSRLTVSWSRDWLQPDELEAHDGHPFAIPLILNAYGEMAGIVDLPTYNKQPQGLGPSMIDRIKKISPIDINLSSSRIVLIAKLQQHEMTATWHARVGQALLLHWHFKESHEYFEKALVIDKQSPTLSSESRSVIYENMSRACFEMGLYEEALKYNNIVETRVFLKTLDEDVDDNRMEILQVLNQAQMEYFAKLPDQAVATAHKAWGAFIASGDRRDWSLWQHFLTNFLDLEQSHRLREVFELGLSHFQQLSQEESPTTLALEKIIEPEILRPRTVYRAIRFSLTPDDEESLQLIARAMEIFKEEVSGWNVLPNVLPKVQYIIGTALFEKGQFATGIRNWYEAHAVTSEPNVDSEFSKSFSTPALIYWRNKPAQERSTSHLAAICLYHPEIAFCDEEPLTLDADAEFGDICLVISSWLRKNGDHANARKALWGRVKKCVGILSDDDPSNDGDSWIELFKTFLVAAGSDEDLSGTLYMMKTWRQIFNHGQPESEKVKEAVEALEEIQLGDDKTLRNQNKKVEPKEEEKVAYDMIWTEWESVTACASCDLLVTSVSHWYFCRSCPHTVLCLICYRDIEMSSVNTFLSQHAPRTCNAHHEFYYTGEPLRFSESADQGMIRLRSSNSDEAQTLWVEEWKDELAEKWGTKEFEFEGGLSAWCMRVLPEGQRERWATFFKV